MQNVITVSLSGIAFTFQQEAYEALDSYLKTLEKGYAKNPDGREIVADIEARIAELILDGQESETVVTLGTIENIISQLGFPDDMDKAPEQPTGQIPKRIYRNPEGAILGGVCSGLGTYFRIDPVWIRIIFFSPLIMTILGGLIDNEVSEIFAVLIPVFMLLYIFLWIAVPMARTPRQKLEMKGERITANSIHQTFADDASTMSPSPKRQRSASVWADIVYTLGRILQFCLKVFIFLIALAFGLAACGILAGIISLLIWGGVMDFFPPDFMPAFDGISVTAYLVITLLAIFIPFMVLFYLLLKLLFGFRTNRTFMLTSGVIWLLLLIYLIVITAHNVDTIKDSSHRIIHSSGTVINDIDDMIDDLDEAAWDDWNGENDIRINVNINGDSVVIDKAVVNRSDESDTLSRQIIRKQTGSGSVWIESTTDAVCGVEDRLQ